MAKKKKKKTAIENLKKFKFREVLNFPSSVRIGSEIEKERFN